MVCARKCVLTKEQIHERERRIKALRLMINSNAESIAEYARKVKIKRGDISKMLSGEIKVTEKALGEI